MIRASRRYGLLLTVVAAVLLGCTGTVLAQSTGSDSSEKTAPDSAQGARVFDKLEELKVDKPGTGRPGSLNATQRRAMSQGYLVPDQSAYERLKAEANARAE